ncbi:MAG: PAS domain-containing protein [Treponema sp.]|nr:PAS domain-containing protein [Treponema sp.]
MNSARDAGKQTTKQAVITGISRKDKEILEAVKPIVDGIAVIFGKNCEVVLHSFDSLDCSVIRIANGHITGRETGSPITDLGMKILGESAGSGSDVTGCYYSKTADGKTLRSATVLIRNNSGKPVGMLCINFNMSASLIDIVDSFRETSLNEQASPEHFVNSIDDLIKTALKSAIAENNNHNNIPNQEKNKVIVIALIKKGIFEIRGAIDIVARELSISRYTIYNYIREYKFSNK